MMEKTETEKKATSVIFFEVEGEQFAIDLLNAREIVPKGQIRRLPQTFEYVEGIYNYRGEIIYVINLSKKLKLYKYKHLRAKKAGEEKEQEESKSNEYIIIASVNDVNTGFLVDRIINISHLKGKDVVGLSPIFETSISMEYIKGIIKSKDRPRILLDVEKILTEAEQVKIQKELSK
ncbi:MAG: chemotaxis protein CheW [Candidatus Lokiarchaeota archaeon]|nr:chemotaxis protein CheW [Candidatus Lokiarchaeota archaeon]